MFFLYIAYKSYPSLPYFPFNFLPFSRSPSRGPTIHVFLANVVFPVFTEKVVDPHVWSLLFHAYSFLQDLRTTTKHRANRQSPGDQLSAAKRPHEYLAKVKAKVRRAHELG